MASAAPTHRPATLDDLRAIPDADRFHEIIDGELVRKAMPSFRHGSAQSELSGILTGPYRRGQGGPGGWRFAAEVEIAFSEASILRPDISGWRRERLADLPDEWPVRVRPDWVCEILSPTNPENDLFKKILIYQRAQVGHYWILDPISEWLAVYRWRPDGFLLVLVASADQRVRAEPFDAIELSVRELLAADEPPR